MQGQDSIHDTSILWMRPLAHAMALRMCGILIAAMPMITMCGVGAAAAAELKIGYLRTPPPRSALSLMDVPARNNGTAGAQMAIEDNNTTGAFTGQSFTLLDVTIKDDDDPATAIGGLIDQGVTFVVTSLDAERLLKAADAARDRGAVLFNVSAPDERLREQDCRANIIHVAPSRSMLADALAQYYAWKKWRRWFLVYGSHDADKLYADALRAAAAKFGIKIVGEKMFEDTGGAKRTDSGIVEVQRQMPLLTQGAPDHDAVVAADESEVFAGYLPYRTWDARPVAGSAGLVPTTWNAAFDQWGALQLQNRFVKTFQRTMTPLDMQAWTAVRMIGEAATRASAAAPKAMLDYLRSPVFSVAAFKGQKLTLRDWNWQLRQPILLFDGRNTVSVSPQDGFLHQTSTLDTLGIDRPATKCKLK